MSRKYVIRWLPSQCYFVNQMGGGVLKALSICGFPLIKLPQKMEISPTLRTPQMDTPASKSERIFQMLFSITLPEGTESKALLLSLYAPSGGPSAGWS